MRTLYVDQYGHFWHALTLQKLRRAVGGGRVSKMYRDGPGGPVHVGYVIGRYWLTAYQPFERPCGE